MNLPRDIDIARNTDGTDTNRGINSKYDVEDIKYNYSSPTYEKQTTTASDNHP